MEHKLLISRGIVVFPNSRITLEVGRQLSMNAVNAVCDNESRQIVIACQKDYEKEDPSFDEIYDVGTLCQITKVDKIEEDKSLKIELIGLERVRLLKAEIRQVKNELPNDDAEANAWVTVVETIKERNIQNEKVIRSFNVLLTEFENNFGKNNPDLIKVRDLIANKNQKIGVAVDQIASLWPLNPDDSYIKQKWLEETNLSKRIDLILENAQISPELRLEIDEKINKKVHQNLNKYQKEMYLRERLKVIKDELGEGLNKDEEINKIRTRLKNEPFPEYIKKKVISELSKLEYNFGMSNEMMMSKNYIDWVMAIPWWQLSKDEQNIDLVENKLNQSHYGLEKVKERIIEYLVLQKRAKKQTGSIICLVGPPGVGKTSLAISIAEALNKKYVKMSLGGLYDESEIRGHRRTYIGSMPGRIIKGMKNAGVVNPLFLLDEIDKLSKDHRGDPASALLEVLDPKQNHRFYDNYIEEDYDLSKVMFLATANFEDRIPEALYDRLEIIHLTSYTEREKLEIAKSYLVGEVLEESFITNKEIKFTDEAITYIIQRYTREAGVRELKRFLAQIVRKFARHLETDPKFTETITPVEVVKYLSKEIYDYTTKDDIVLPGVVNGMAYTSAGGDLLPIEVNFYPGKGNLVLTGNLKETMKESASVALGFVRANEERFGLVGTNWQNIDIQINVPAGGIPKDGPSAGVTLATAIISALTKKPVPNDIAMTGEITLRGKVLIIGGVKEKIISAVRGGVSRVFLPKDDLRFLEDVPKEILNKIEIFLVDNYDQIYEYIFSDDPRKKILPTCLNPKPLPSYSN